MMKHSVCVGLSLLALVGAPAIIRAQAPPLDADRAGRTVQVFGPNQDFEGRPSLVVETEFAMPAGGHYRVEGANGTPCDLVIKDSGVLRFVDAVVEVRGNVRFLEGGYCEFVDSRVTLLNSYSREFNYLWDGGHLSTTRVTIGGFENDASASVPSTFELTNGLWTVRDTVVRDSYGILLGSRVGPPGRQGGYLVADGLHQGRTSDALLLSGRGDATLRNSTFPVQLTFFPGTAQTIDLDLTSSHRITRVYGDRNVHDALHRRAVTDHIDGSPWRLELVNTRVPLWIIGVHHFTQQTPDVTFRVQNATELTTRIDMTDLRGSPVLIGPWRTYYPAPHPLPGLPGKSPPGQHGIPPGCGVKIGPVTIAAPNDQWAYPYAWSFTLDGARTDFTVRGIAVINELFLRDAKVTLEGNGPYDLLFRMISLDMSGRSMLTVKNATVGVSHTWQPEMTVRAHSTVDVQNCEVKNVLLHTAPGRAGGPHEGVDNASITIRDSLITGNVTQLRSPGSTIDVQRAPPDRDYDLTNLDFERGVQPNGNPEFWSGNNVSGYPSQETAPDGRGRRSFGYRSTNTTGSISKTIAVRPRTKLELFGWVKARQLGSGATFDFALEGSSGNRVVTTVVPVVGRWTYVRTPPLEALAQDTTVRAHISHRTTSGGVEILLDNFKLPLLQWWDADTLANLDFEDADYIDLGGLQAAPNHWSTWRSTAATETNDLRPGAAPGSRATRITSFGSFGVVKAMTGLVPGQTIEVTGWAKGEAHAGGPFDFRARLSEGNECWWVNNYGNNVVFSMTSGTGWNRFRLSYIVPAPPFKEYSTWLLLHSVRTGAQLLLDDITVQIR